MRKSCIGILMLVLLTACSSNADLSVYAPESTDVPLRVWMRTYPIEFKEWSESVHGVAYLAGDTNAATCNDCHDDPETADTGTAAFHQEIPGRCGRCHSDKEMMSGYDISADVYDTYLADFHGTTIAYYQAVDPDSIRYEAVCTDCHGSHAIHASDNESSSVHANNLTATCQKCHHEAPTAFVSAFGHYRTTLAPVSSADSPVVFLVKLFYQALTPIILGGMFFYILIDIRFRLKNRKKDHV